MKQPAIQSIFIALLLLFLQNSIFSQSDSSMMVSPIETDRPDQTETASIVPKGWFQMENGFSIEDTEPGFIYTHPSTLWKFGVSEHFEIRLLTEYINIQRAPNPDVDGLLPVQVGIKARLLDQRGIVPKTSVIAHLSLPGIASEHFQQSFFAPSLRLAFQHAIQDRFTVSYNLGAEWDGETARPDFIYTFAVGANLIAGLGAYAEIYGNVPQQIEDDHQLRFDAGLTYHITDDIMADVSGGIGLSDNAPEKYIAAGLSYRFKL